MQGLHLSCFENQVLQDALLAHSKDSIIISHCMGNCVIIALDAS